MTIDPNTIILHQLSGPPATPWNVQAELRRLFNQPALIVEFSSLPGIGCYAIGDFYNTDIDGPVRTFAVMWASAKNQKRLDELCLV